MLVHTNIYFHCQWGTEPWSGVRSSGSLSQMSSNQLRDLEPVTLLQALVCSPPTSTLNWESLTKGPAMALKLQHSLILSHHSFLCWSTVLSGMKKELALCQFVPDKQKKRIFHPVASVCHRGGPAGERLTQAGVWWASLNREKVEKAHSPLFPSQQHLVLAVWSWTGQLTMLG